MWLDMVSIVPIWDFKYWYTDTFRNWEGRSIHIFLAC